MSEARVNANSTRRQQILEMLAHELETNPGSRITTASLARALGVSEAALYRHFPSKARMFEGLISFAEDTVFGLIARILEEHAQPADRCAQMLRLLLGFAERNPGIARILAGDALVGENERLRERVTQFFDRIETQFRQVLREAVLASNGKLSISVNAAAALLLGIAEGRVAQFVRSEFKLLPLSQWDEIWPALSVSLFQQRP